VVEILLRQAVDQPRRLGHHALRRLVLGVERAQRVEVDPLDDLAAQLVLVGPQVRGQLRAVGRAVLGLPERRDHEVDVTRPDRLQQLRQQQDDLRVHGRVGRADRLRAHLPELPVAPRLRRLLAEEARQVPELHGLRELVHPVLHVRAHRRRGALRPQRVGAVVGLEGEHLLLDDVRRLPHAA
jgi:hypothetical protein